jgi:hypothetical protein
LFPFCHTAAYSIDETVINSKQHQPGKSPGKQLVFATLHSSLHWLVEVVDANQNIQVPNKDKIHFINHHIFHSAVRKITQKFKEQPGGML